MEVAHNHEHVFREAPPSFSLCAFLWPLLVGRALLLELLSLSFCDESTERAKVLVDEVLIPLLPFREAEQ